MKGITAKNVPAELYTAAKDAWDEAVRLGELYGYRNAQATVLAPTGTIGFMMDCDTTGVEPDIALVKYKKLVGGGLMKIVNQTVPMALAKLGYTEQQIKAIIDFIDEHETIEGAPELKPEHLPVFDCAFKAAKGRAVDPLHGAHQDDGRHAAVHLGRDLQDGERAEGGDRRRHHAGLHPVVEARRQGDLDLPRRQQAHAAAQHVEGQDGGGGGEKVVAAMGQPVRRRLPDERKAITHKFDIAGHEGYITVGLFEDGQPGEIFLVMAKEGSTISGFADAFAQAISYALQYGVPLQALVDKFSHARFEPSGMTKNPDIRFAKSIVDYIFRWLATKFLSPEAQFRAGVNNREENARKSVRRSPHRPCPASAGPRVPRSRRPRSARRRMRRSRTRKTRRPAARAGRSWCAAAAAISARTAAARPAARRVFSPPRGGMGYSGPKEKLRPPLFFGAVVSPRRKYVGVRGPRRGGWGGMVG